MRGLNVETPLLWRYYDELSLGDSQVTRARTVTETDVVNWCAFTGDWFLLHSDKEYAERSMFGQRIAPGMMVLAISGGLGVPPDSTAILANYGTDRIRYPIPTFIGDTVHLELEVVARNDRDEASGIVDFRWDVVNQNGETVAASQLRVLLAKNGAHA
jgi:3-hydroxybutyryl-CoA dehydratase